MSCYQQSDICDGKGEHFISKQILEIKVVAEMSHICSSHSPDKGRVQKFMLGKFVDFSIKWVGGLPLVH